MEDSFIAIIEVTFLRGQREYRVGGGKCEVTDVLDHERIAHCLKTKPGHNIAMDGDWLSPLPGEVEHN
jgi:hypothetical protein